VTPATQRSWAGLAIGLGLIGLAGVIGVDTWRMRVPPTYAKVGPQVFPVIVTLGLAIAGALIAWTSRTKPIVEEATHATDWSAVAIISGALILHLNLLKPVGFIPTSALLFFAVAFAFGSRHYLRDALIAIVLAVIVYIGFVHGLRLRLPAGLLEGVI
jgi:putative tricarboxylic transport membrane protein